ncbi:hypothetical protein LMG33810_002074 [Carnimonas sp. LMG 33810]
MEPCAGMWLAGAASISGQRCAFQCPSFALPPVLLVAVASVSVWRAALFSLHFSVKVVVRACFGTLWQWLWREHRYQVRAGSA